MAGWFCSTSVFVIYFHISSLCLSDSYTLHGWLSLVWGLHWLNSFKEILPDGSARFLGQIPSKTQVLSTCSTCFPQVSARWWNLFLTLLASCAFHSCLSLFVRVGWFCLYINLLFLNQKPESGSCPLMANWSSKGTLSTNGIRLQTNSSHST